MDDNIKIDRQAVVIIHGIGEQNPMDTLRDFVISIAPKIRNSTKPKFYNKPDHLSSLFELRRITANQHADSFKTDYFEYYWASAMRDTKAKDVWFWFLKILLRKPNHIPARLKWLYFLFWALLIIAIVLVGSVLFGTASNLTNTLSTKHVKLLISGVLLIVNYFIVSYLGDAARYMTPNPGNIAERQKIRQNGLELLQKLHDQQEDGKNKYDRIIVVGHSLGSVIAYDLLNLYWAKVHTYSSEIEPANIEAIESLANKLDDSPESLENFRNGQFEFWKSQSKVKGCWRISDFITLGSPLAHAKLFTAKSPQVFTEKVNEREYPTCPPTSEDENGFNRFSFSTKGNRQLHHAAGFALTRWTNVYFRNDFIGGPINDLGRGVENKELVPQKLTWGFLPLRSLIPFISHTCYWDKAEIDNNDYTRDKMELRFKKAANDKILVL